MYSAVTERVYTHQMMRSISQPVMYIEKSAAARAYHKSEQVLYDAAKANTIQREYTFVPDDFLKSGRKHQPFVGAAEEIEEAVKEAFRATLDEEFPTDIQISIMDEKDFRKHAPDPGVVGFSINRKDQGAASDVCILAAEKDRVMLTIGHEIGHVLSKTLKNKHSEEAKAFAFTRAWMNAIKENDIAGLGDAIVLENPSQNGLHDKACAFVAMMMHAGKDALKLYRELVNGWIEVSSDAISL